MDTPPRCEADRRHVILRKTTSAPWSTGCNWLEPLPAVTNRDRAREMHERIRARTSEPEACAMTPTSKPVGKIAGTNPIRHTPRLHGLGETNPGNRPNPTGSAPGGAGVRHTCEPKPAPARWQMNERFPMAARPNPRPQDISHERTQACRRTWAIYRTNPVLSVCGRRRGSTPLQRGGARGRRSERTQGPEPVAQRDPAPQPCEPERLSGASPQTRMGPGWS